MKRLSNPAPGRIAAALLGCFIFECGALGLQEASSQQSVVTNGERLDAASLGPGTVESMDAVLQREAQIPPQPVNTKDRNGRQGSWIVPSPRATYFPHSGVHNVVNEWGDTNMGIGFSQPLTIEGAYFAGQGGEGAWTSGVRAVGYRNGEQVAVTPWLADIGPAPRWLAMDFTRVDRIEIQSMPVLNGGGWYSMDDLTLTAQAGHALDANAQRIVIDFEDCKFNQKLTGTEYAGLNWEIGRGDFLQQHDDAVPGPSRRLEEPEIQIRPGEDGGTGGIAGELATAPVLVSQFQGAIRGDANQFSYPPDTCGAIGPQHFVEVVNRNFSVYEKATGIRIVNTSLGSFLPGGSGDPRVLFDQHSGRWIVIDSDFNTRIYLAMSMSDDPTGSWFKTSFVATQGAGSFPDYPTLGVDADGIYISAYIVGGGLSIFVIDKAPLLADPPSLGSVTAFGDLPFEGAIQPVHTYGIADGQYFVSRGGHAYLQLRRVTGPLTDPQLETLPPMGVPGNVNAPDAPALGSNVPLDTVDTRLMNAVYRDGHIWCAHTISVDGRAACRWYKIHASSNIVITYGTIQDPSLYYFFPTVMVNAAGDVLMGFSGSNAAQYAASYFTGRAHTDPPGYMATPVLLRAGAGPQNNIDNFGRNRWGDYSLTSLDPSDEMTMWTVQEYAHANNIWGTWIGELIVPAPPANNDCANAAIVLPGSTAFSTVNANTDGPDDSCTFDGQSQIENDIWFLYLAQCTGTVSVSLCGADFDSRLAVYLSPSPCPSIEPGTALYCDDNSCGDDPEISFQATAGDIYRFRVGSHQNLTGTGTLIISCTDDPLDCSADVSPQGGDNVVNVADLLAVIGGWGGCLQPCPPFEACPADVDNNCIVNVNDLLAIVSEWGECP